MDFDNRFIREMPADSQKGLGTRQVQGAAYSWVNPTPVANPDLLGYSSEVATLLDLDDADIQSREFLNAFSGNVLLPGMQHMRRITAVINSVTGQGSLAMGVPSALAKLFRKIASAGSCS